MCRGIRIKKLPYTLTFKKTDSPAICVMVRKTSSGLKAGEGEAYIGGNVTIHSEELAHEFRIAYNPWMDRIVYCEDAIEWLRNYQDQGKTSFLGSLPDFSEFQSYTLEEWKEWFATTAGLILSKTSPDGVTIFFQSDIKFEGTWVDKGFLVQKAAEKLGHELLWHKIFCRAPAGTVMFGRPSYSHMLCFSKNGRVDISKSTADVIPDLGEKTWVRGMGLEASLMASQFIKKHTTSSTLINPFCGEGSVLAAANYAGLNAIGIERSPKRAQKARELQVAPDGKSWNPAE